MTDLHTLNRNQRLAIALPKKRSKLDDVIHRQKGECWRCCSDQLPLALFKHGRIKRALCEACGQDPSYQRLNNDGHLLGSK